MAVESIWQLYEFFHTTASCLNGELRVVDPKKQFLKKKHPLRWLAGGRMVALPKRLDSGPNLAGPQPDIAPGLVEVFTDDHAHDVQATRERLSRSPRIGQLGLFESQLVPIGKSPMVPIDRLDKEPHNPKQALLDSTSPQQAMRATRWCILKAKA